MREATNLRACDDTELAMPELMLMSYPAKNPDDCSARPYFSIMPCVGKREKMIRGCIQREREREREEGGRGKHE